MSATTTDKRPHGHLVIGAIAGFVFGGSISALLLPLGVLTLDSVVLLILPIAGLVLGLAWAWWAPLGRPKQPKPPPAPPEPTMPAQPPGPISSDPQTEATTLDP